ncbi:MAG TPA: tetratricopeptide repeat protein [Pyrinomonadaceae bacterium]|jgi:tetratricopeptide (TPR) repeat protein
MLKNLILCAVGVVVGFVVGFVIIDKVTRPFAGGGTAARAAPAGGDARPLNPDQMGDELPPGHPSVEGGAGGAGAGTAASTSPAAQAAMEKADRSPKEFAAQAEAARVFYGLHDYDKATLYADRALKLKGTDFDTLVLAGNARYDAKDFAAAATFYESALAVRPASPDVRTDLGNTHFNRGDFDRAMAEYRKSLAVDSDHVNSWRNIAAAALQKGDRKTAEEAVAQLSRLSPQSPEVEAYRQRIAQMP